MYYMPRNENNLTICGFEDMACVKWVDRQLQLKKNDSFKCPECLGGCFSIHYDSTFSTAKIFNETPYLSKHKLKARDIAFVHTYFARSTFRSQRKEELVGFTDFLCK